MNRLSMILYKAWMSCASITGGASFSRSFQVFSFEKSSLVSIYREKAALEERLYKRLLLQNNSKNYQMMFSVRLLQSCSRLAKSASISSSPDTTASNCSWNSSTE